MLFRPVAYFVRISCNKHVRVILNIYSITIYIPVAHSKLYGMTSAAFQNSYSTKIYNRKTKSAYFFSF